MSEDDKKDGEDEENSYEVGKDEKKHKETHVPALRAWCAEFKYFEREKD